MSQREGTNTTTSLLLRLCVNLLLLLLLLEKQELLLRQLGLCYFLAIAIGRACLAFKVEDEAFRSSFQIFVLRTGLIAGLQRLKLDLAIFWRFR